MSLIPQYLRYINIESIILRFLIAAICSGIIGLCRGKKQHSAGFRTHLLVCVGSACIMMINQYMSQYMDWGGDIGRMGAQVVSGIGFLGAGTILVTSKKHIKGLTSAAGIWASACMGLAVGIGFYEAAIIMCILMFIIIYVLEYVDELFIKTSSEVTVYVEYNSAMLLSYIIKEIRHNGWYVKGIEQLVTNADNINSFILTLEVDNKDIQKKETFDRLKNINGIYYIERI